MTGHKSKITRRNFIGGCCVAMGSIATGATVIPVISAWRPADDLVFDEVGEEVDISAIEPGQMKIIGISLNRETLVGSDSQIVPVMILRRKKKWIEELDVMDINLKDPVEAKERFINPEWFVARAFCTHLGCTPTIIDEASKPVTIVCPCHGGLYDTLGRVLGGPPPLNLFMIPYKFTSEDTIKLVVLNPNDLKYGKISDFKGTLEV
jgi:ubiquinol-cytochrome c reductase iron-sulfur subunit